MSFLMIGFNEIFSWSVFQGDILTTAGGGTAVIFNDVEVITKKSPGDRYEYFLVVILNYM